MYTRTHICIHKYKHTNIQTKNKQKTPKNPKKLSEKSSATTSAFIRIHISISDALCHPILFPSGRVRSPPSPGAVCPLPPPPAFLRSCGEHLQRHRLLQRAHGVGGGGWGGGVECGASASSGGGKRTALEGGRDEGIATHTHTYIHNVYNVYYVYGLYNVYNVYNVYDVYNTYTMFVRMQSR